MRKIKIKVKHIIIVFLLLVFVVPNGLVLYGFYKINQYMKDINGIPAYVSQEGLSYRIFSNDRIDERAVGILQSMAEIPTIMYSKGEIYNKLGNSYYDMSINRVYISENRATYDGFTNRKGIDKAIEYFEMGVELGEESKYYESNFKSLINCYLIIGEREKVVELIDKSLNSDKVWVKNLGIVTMAVLLGKEGEYDEALSIYKADIDNIIDMKIYLNLLIMAGKTDKHDEYVKELYSEKFGNGHTEHIEEETFYFIDYGYNEGNRKVNELDFHQSSSHSIMNREFGKGKFKGRVTVEGEGIPYTLVYLSSNNNKERITEGFNPSDKNIYYGYTDKDGNFEIDGINNGSYRVYTEVSSIYFETISILSNNKGFNEVIIEDNTIERELEIN